MKDTRHCAHGLGLNPNHLGAVTRRLNLMLGRTIPAAHAQKTQCPQGHPYDAENTYVYRRQRHCLRCRRMHRTRSRERARRRAEDAQAGIA